MSTGKPRSHILTGSSVQAKELHPHGLPQPPHSLIGRKKDLEAAQDLILRGNVRLVTVTGPPGVGKTRFAVELASTVASEFDDGVVFSDLAPVRDPGLVLDAIARAMGVIEHPDRPPLERLQRHLDGRNVLLLLDNFEQVIAAATGVADLLAACPDVKVLVTSRQPLHVRWEHRYNLLPLVLPDAAARSEQGRLARSPAIALFIERARAAEPAFGVDDRSAPIVAEICRRLDGLPLAIELTAAWVGALGLDAILARLSGHLGLPQRGPGDVSERQRTLFNAIAWSYDLMSEAERSVFRASGAFAGETPLEAIEAVCEGLRVDVLTAVAGLVDKNLLVRVGDNETRFRMLETIREFAVERLELTGEADAVRRRHAAWFLGLAQRAERFLWSEHQMEWFPRLERAHDNVRAALEWCLGGRDEETGVLLAASMTRFWFARGHIREGRRWGQIAASKQQVSPKARALALSNLAFFVMQQGERDHAVRLAAQGVALARSVGEPSLIAWSLLQLGLATDTVGDFERSEPIYREMLDFARQAGNERVAILALHNVGTTLRLRGDKARARPILEEVLAMARPRHDRWLTSLATGNLGSVLASDDPVHAVQLLEESLALAHEIGHPWLTIRRLEDLAAVVASSDRAEIAAGLLGASAGLRDAFGFAPSGWVQAEVDDASAAARERLRPAAFDAAYAKGRAMTADEAVALALGRSAPAPQERPQRPGGLTGREVQIALDIARGLTNRLIAERLGIRQRTVEAHVQNILNKLGMERRAQIAAWAAVHLPKGTPA
ncbi:MAG: LuxR C-terminal-related transcriptional regulator [Armatimonadota bacterium]|nr:LuxR C-terminal-related transcriptional regulator [Armatimonadota bacterium]